MRKKANVIAAEYVGKMTDAELAKKLGHYRRASLIWNMIGIVGVLSGTVSFFALQNPILKAILVTVLFFGGICCVLFPGGDARQKLKVLIQEKLRDFFREEFEKVFGTEICIPELRIDESFIKVLDPIDGKWEECEADCFHEGSYRGVQFSAVNIRLNHVYKKAIPHEGLNTCRNQVFKGIVLRCKTRIAAPTPIRATERTANSSCGAADVDKTFDRNISILAEPDIAATCLFYPNLPEQLEKLERCAEGHICCFQWEKDTFSLALETDFEFASVAGNTDLGDLDAVRLSYIRSLRKMEKLLDILLDNTALF